MFNVTTVLPHNLLQTNPCIRHNFSTQVFRKRAAQLHYVAQLRAHIVKCVYDLGDLTSWTFVMCGMQINCLQAREILVCADQSASSDVLDPVSCRLYPPVTGIWSSLCFFVRLSTHGIRILSSSQALNPETRLSPCFQDRGVSLTLSLCLPQISHEVSWDSAPTY